MPKLKTKHFYEIFKDDTRRLFEILGPSTDDTELSHQTSEMLRHGLEVHCSTSAVGESQQAVKAGYEKLGFTYQAGIYSEMKAKLAKLKYAAGENPDLS